MSCFDAGDVALSRVLPVAAFLAHVARAILAGVNLAGARFPGGYSAGATPLTIPNRAVKPCSADGTAFVVGE